MKLKWAEERIIHSVGIQAPPEQNTQASSSMQVCVFVCERERETVKTIERNLFSNWNKVKEVMKYIEYHYLQCALLLWAHYCP